MLEGASVSHGGGVSVPFHRAESKRSPLWPAYRGPSGNLITSIRVGRAYGDQWNGLDATRAQGNYSPLMWTPYRPSRSAPDHPGWGKGRPYSPSSVPPRP